MIKGGYQIIDLQNKKLTGGAGVIYEGVYDKIDGNRKAILVSGLKIGGREYRDTFVEFHINGSTWEGIIYGYTITVQTNDTVTIKPN